MTAYADLEPLPSFGVTSAPYLRAVGWLERSVPFAVGEVDARVYRRLSDLLSDPFQPFVSAGSHGCSLCLYDAGARGSRNLFIPGRGFLYVCPELILHYMSAHHYAPPSEFCNAVLLCPDQRTSDFRGMLLANGGAALLQRAR